MSKKTILILLGFIFLFSFRLARAEVIINEIMYAPINGEAEWIEIFNSGNNSVDLTDWRFFNNADDSAPLRLQKGSALLSGGSYAIITSTADWNSFSGTVFSSSQFSLPNDSSKYNTYKAISDSDKKIINSVTYTTLADASGTGNSLQFFNNLWQAASPTPGAPNYISAGSTAESNNSSVSYGLPANSFSAQDTVDTKTKAIEIPQIKTKIIAPTLAFVGMPVLFNASATGYSGESLFSGKYFWNFGDGDSKEIKLTDATKFTHTFFYEGEYAVSLEYYQNYYSENPNASDKITIKIVPADISISRVGDEKDFFVEISNNTNYDADLSKWVLSSAERSFTLPKNTILKSKSKMMVSSKITNFSILDKDTLKLINPQGETIFDYAALQKPIKTLTNSSASAKISTAKDNSNATAEIPVDNLLAQIPPNNTATKDNFKYGILGLVAFLGISTSATYFIRSRKRKITSQTAGNDFEIIDE